MSLTRPLELERHLSAPERRLEVVPLFDALLICLMFIMLGSRFVSAPGEEIQLPVIDGPTPPGVATLAVLTYKSDEMMILDGRVVTLEGWKRLIDRDESPGDGVLLVKADADLPTQTLLKLAALAREAGFTGLQIAANGSGEDNFWNKAQSSGAFDGIQP